MSEKNQQQSTSAAAANTNEQLANMLETGTGADVFFLVGKPGEVQKLILAHTFILLSVSTVFEAQFRHGNSNVLGSSREKPIVVNDVSPNTFWAMLRYIYAGEFGRMTSQGVMDVYFAANKYRLEPLAKHCLSLLVNWQNPTSALDLLKHAKRYEDKELIDHCSTFVHENAHAILGSKEFLSLNQADLCELFSHLRTDKLFLFQSLYRWANHQCLTAGRENTAGNLRDIIGSAIHLVPFHCMDQGEFTKEIVPTGLLNKDEVIALYVHFTGNRAADEHEPPSLEATPPRRRLEPSAPPETPPTANPSTTNPWIVTAQEHQSNEGQFAALKPMNGMIGGEQARSFFSKFGLSATILAQIWQLCDLNKKGKLDRLEFSIALKLVRNSLAGLPLPPTLPDSMRQIGGHIGSPQKLATRLDLDLMLSKEEMADFVKKLGRNTLAIDNSAAKKWLSLENISILSGVLAIVLFMVLGTSAMVAHRLDVCQSKLSLEKNNTAICRRSLPRPSIINHQLMAIFNEFASVDKEKEDGRRYMTASDFIQKYVGLEDNYYNREAIGQLVYDADTSKDELISFEEFSAFEASPCASDALYLTAFEIFDNNASESITADDFKKFIRHFSPLMQLDFDFNGEFIKKYFGARKQRSIGYHAFCQLLHDFYEEQGKKAFKGYDKENNGTISDTDFYKIMTTVKGHLLTKFVSDNMVATARLSSSAHKVRFPFFQAFNSLLAKMDLMKRVYTSIARGNIDLKVTREEFLQASRAYVLINAEEVEILFTLAELYHPSYRSIDLHDLEQLDPERLKRVSKIFRLINVEVVNSKEERGFGTKATVPSGIVFDEWTPVHHNGRGQ